MALIQIVINIMYRFFVHIFKNIWKIEEILKNQENENTGEYALQ